MSSHVSSLKISYFSVPKCACTSLKTFFFEVENGFSFNNFQISGAWYHIHQFYLSRDFNFTSAASPVGFDRFAVIRCPVSRMVSCYRNRVGNDVGYNIMMPYFDKLQSLGVPTRPSWEDFLENFQVYREVVPMIKHHSETLSYFLGYDPAYFSRIYDISDVNSFAEMVAGRAGKNYVLGREQTNGVNFTVADVSQSQRSKVKQLFAEDYELFGRFFSER